MVQTEEEQPAHMHSLAHEICIILSLSVEKVKRKGNERVFAVNRAVSE